MDEAAYEDPSVRVQLSDDIRGLPLPLMGHRVYSISLAGGGCVMRRYTDFRRLHDSLVQRRPLRLIPELPNRGRPELLPNLPGGSSLALRQRRQRRQFLEQRESGLRNYLVALLGHLVLSRDAELMHFLKHNGEEFLSSANQARTAAGGWEREPSLADSAAAAADSIGDNGEQPDDKEDRPKRIELWLTRQRNVIAARLEILADIRRNLERHQEAAWAAAGALRGLAENFPLAVAEATKDSSAAGLIESVADEIPQRCDAERLASQQPIDWLQMQLLGFLRLHDRLSTAVAVATAASASSTSGTSSLSALQFACNRLLLEARPVSGAGSHVLRQLLVQVTGVQLHGNLILESEWHKVDDSIKETEQ